MRRTRATLVAPLLGLCLAAYASTAHADVTLALSLKGTIFSDGNQPVKVNCSGKENNTVRFVDGDVSVDTLPAFTLQPTCELHSAMGLFNDGERFNNEPIDEDSVAVMLTKKSGAETRQEVAASESDGSGSGNITMTIVYNATMVADKTTGTLMPPIRAVRGTMLLVNDSSGEIFVGKFSAK